VTYMQWLFDAGLKGGVNYDVLGAHGNTQAPDVDVPLNSLPQFGHPSFYFRRNWRVAFMIDHYAVANRHTIGVDNLLWSTDYPHHGCDWPETRRVVDEMFRGVPDDERNKMCALNAAKLYKLI